MRGIELTEHQIQQQILDYLALHRIFHYRQNTGAFAGEHNGKKRYVRFGKKGAPDIIACIEGRFVGIEVKAEGQKQSIAQIEYQDELERSGGVYVLAYGLDDVQDLLWSLTGGRKR